ncbi:hypothetical protein KY342_02590 [Candidatus Woesearchaeota archaeon]|nr:hypothetical protein [Candidatus Woesearchaeota archaeon]
MEPTQIKQENGTIVLERVSTSTDYLSRFKQMLRDNVCPDKANCKEPVCLRCYNKRDVE